MKRIIGGRGKSLPLRLPIKVQTVKMKDVIFVQRIDFGFSDNGFFPNTKLPRNSCFASILTYCATHTLPYLCTPTSVSCLSLEPFSAVHQRAEKGFSTRWAAGENPCRYFHFANTSSKSKKGRML